MAASDLERFGLAARPARQPARALPRVRRADLWIHATPPCLPGHGSRCTPLGVRNDSTPTRAPRVAGLPGLGTGLRPRDPPYQPPAHPFGGPGVPGPGHDRRLRGHETRGACTRGLVQSTAPGHHRPRTESRRRPNHGFSVAWSGGVAHTRQATDRSRRIPARPGRGFAGPCHRGPTAAPGRDRLTSGLAAPAAPGFAGVLPIAFLHSSRACAEASGTTTFCLPGGQIDPRAAAVADCNEEADA